MTTMTADGGTMKKMPWWHAFATPNKGSKGGEHVERRACAIVEDAVAGNQSCSTMFL